MGMKIVHRPAPSISDGTYHVVRKGRLLFCANTRTEARRYIRQQVTAGGVGAATQSWFARPALVKSPLNALRHYRNTLPL